MADMDALRYVQDLLDFHANTVIINAGGIIASYPTNIPGHSLNRYLTGDPLKKVIKACKEALIRVAVRVDFSKVRKEVFEGHQNWAYISPSGEIIDYFGNIHVCFNSDYQQRIAFDIVSEILTYLKPDALFMNMPGYSAGYNYTKGWMGICQCESCRKRFSEMTGKMLPKKEDPGDPDYIAYVRFQQETMAEYQQRLRDLCRQEAPDLLIFQDDMIRIESNTWLEEKERNYPRRAAEQLKLMKGSYPDKEVSVTSVDFIDMKYRYASVSPWQQKIRIAESLANGGFADFYQAGRMDNHPNRSGYAPLREMFAYAAEHEKDYRPAESCADIALVKASGNYFHRMNGNEYLGWYDILTNGHYIFDCIESSVLPVISLEKYKTVILGGVSNIGTELKNKLDAFVANGGTLIASGGSSVCTGIGSEKESRWEAMGIIHVKSTAQDILSAYFDLKDEKEFTRFTDEEWLYLFGRYTYADYDDHTALYGKMIPPHRHSPIEDAYTKEKTADPAVSVHRYGKGYGVFIPWDAGKTYDSQRFPDTERFIWDLLEHILGIHPVTGNLPPQVEISRTGRNGESVEYIHLVNDSGWFAGCCYTPVTMEDLSFTIHVPGKTVTDIFSLVSGNRVPFRQEGELLSVHLKRLELFEALKLYTV